MRRLNSELGNPQGEPTTVMEDDQSCSAMAKNPQYHGKSKHIDIKYHFVRDLVGDKTITIFPRSDAVATINFSFAGVRLLIEGGSYSRVAFINLKQCLFRGVARIFGKGVMNYARAKF